MEILLSFFRSLLLFFEKNSIIFSIIFLFLTVMTIGQYGYLKTLKKEHKGKYSKIFFLIFFLVTSIEGIISIDRFLEKISLSSFLITALMIAISKLCYDFGVDGAQTKIELDQTSSDKYS